MMRTTSVSCDFVGVLDGTKKHGMQKLDRVIDLFSCTILFWEPLQDLKASIEIAMV